MKLSLLDDPRMLGQLSAMAEQDKVHKLSWPSWAPWALLAVGATSLLTIAATLYDIL